MGQIQFSDKLLPNQQEFCKDYQGTQAQLVVDMFQVIADTCNLTLPHEEFDLVESDKFSIAEMGSNPILLRFLAFLITLKRPEALLEVGTFIGVSALNLAKAAGPSARVTTIEKFDHFAAIARQNFENNGFSDNIELLEGDAGPVLEEICPKRRFDFVFLDGSKENYLNYFRIIEPALNPGAVVIVDDVLFHGDVLNEEPTTEKGAGVKDFLKHVEQLEDFLPVLLPMGNGVMLLIKQ